MADSIYAVEFCFPLSAITGAWDLLCDADNTYRVSL